MASHEDIMNILCMAITVDGSIHHDEIETVQTLIRDEFPNENLDSTLSLLHTLKSRTEDDVTHRYKESVNSLKTLPKDEKLKIIKMVMKVVDADKVMHSSEQKMLSSLMDNWGITF